MRSPRTTTKSSPRSPQVEKAPAQQQRHNTAKKKKKELWLLFRVISLFIFSVGIPDFFMSIGRHDFPGDSEPYWVWPWNANHTCVVSVSPALPRLALPLVLPDCPGAPPGGRKTKSLVTRCGTGAVSRETWSGWKCLYSPRRGFLMLGTDLHPGPSYFWWKN